jgi:hypothetical protein
VGTSTGAATVPYRAPTLRSASGFGARPSRSGSLGGSWSCLPSGAEVFGAHVGLGGPPKSFCRALFAFLALRPLSLDDEPVGKKKDHGACHRRRNIGLAPPAGGLTLPAGQRGRAAIVGRGDVKRHAFWKIPGNGAPYPFHVRRGPGGGARSARKPTASAARATRPEILGGGVVETVSPKSVSRADRAIRRAAPTAE